MYIGVRAFGVGVNVQSNFILIRYFDWPYKKIIIRSAYRTGGQTNRRTDKNRQTIAVTLHLRFEARANQYAYI